MHHVTRHMTVHVPFAQRWVRAKETFPFLEGEGEGRAGSEELGIFERRGRFCLRALLDCSRSLAAWPGNDPAMAVNVKGVERFADACNSEAHSCLHTCDQGGRVAEKLAAINAHA